MPHDMEFGKAIRRLRTSLNLTQAEAARQAEMPTITFALAERGSAGFYTRKRILKWMERADKAVRK